MQQNVWRKIKKAKKNDTKKKMTTPQVLEFSDLRMPSEDRKKKKRQM